MIRQRDGEPRLPTVREKELLLGFEAGYTAPATKSSLSKTHASEDYAIKSSLLGDSFNVHCFAWVVAHALYRWHYISRIPFLAELKDKTAYLLARECCVVPVVEVARPLSGLTREQRMVLLLFSRTDGRGSDVRLSSGELQRPNRVARTPVDPGLWVWDKSFSWKYFLHEHINVLNSGPLSSS